MSDLASLLNSKISQTQADTLYSPLKAYTYVCCSLAANQEGTGVTDDSVLGVSDNWTVHTDNNSILTSSTGKFTIPDTGLYRISMNVSTYSTNGGFITHTLYKYTTTAVVLTSARTRTGDTTYPSMHTLEYLGSLDQGDLVYVVANDDVVSMSGNAQGTIIIQQLS